MSLNAREFYKKIKDTQRYLSEHSDLHVTVSDKSNITVCMKKDIYIEEMNMLLNDKSTYKIVKQNPLNRMRDEVKDILRDFNDNKYLNKVYHKNTFTLTETVLPKSYGLVKTHKICLPLRPIVSTVNSPTYFLSKLLCKK